MVEPTKDEEKEYLAYRTEKDFFSNLQEGIRKLRSIQLPIKEHIVCVCGGMAGFDKGLLNFLNVYAEEEKRKGRNVVLLSEVTAEYRRYTAEKVTFPFICTPHLLAKEIIVLGMKISVSSQMKEYIKDRDFIKEAILLMKARHPQVGEGYAEAWGYYACIYIEELLKKINPEKVILWNEFYAFHRLFDSICKINNISVEYMEFGCLPGTIAIDKTGQMGESSVAIAYKEFRKLHITRFEYTEMKNILGYLHKSGLNRNIQPRQCFQKHQIYLFRSDNPIIIFFGQNDFESGFFPYTNYAKVRHSPIFKSTVSAAEYLLNLSIKNNWNFVYKAHPIMQALGLGYLGTDKEIKKYMVNDVDINSLIDCASVCITIFSQSAYISLIRNKPVVMLGYSQLRGKRCTYEAFKRKKIEKTIKRALHFGFTLKQKEQFIKHCAQLKKYYLLDDLQEKTVMIGRDIKTLRNEYSGGEITRRKNKYDYGFKRN